MLNRDHLTILQCKSCGSFHVPPKIICNFCGGNQLDEHSTGGKGYIFSFTKIHVCPDKFNNQVPYDLVIVELEEGIRATARLMKTMDAPVAINAPVIFTREDEYGAWFRML